jgi:hypothetical protein
LRSNTFDLKKSDYFFFQKENNQKKKEIEQMDDGIQKQIQSSFRWQIIDSSFSLTAWLLSLMITFFYKPYSSVVILILVAMAFARFIMDYLWVRKTWPPLIIFFSPIPYVSPLETFPVESPDTIGVSPPHSLNSGRISRVKAFGWTTSRFLFSTVVQVFMIWFLVVRGNLSLRDIGITFLPVWICTAITWTFLYYYLLQRLDLWNVPRTVSQILNNATHDVHLNPLTCSNDTSTLFSPID